MSQRQKSFGEVLREKRLAKGFSLRKFAKLVDVSPTYLSQVEQENVDPPTAERVQRMAELLGENADELIALAGRVPEDLPAIIQRRPTAIPELLREANGLSADQLRALTEHVRKIKQKGR
jgi:transcriptional regulator with XRE-family HTH domain